MRGHFVSWVLGYLDVEAAGPELQVFVNLLTRTGTMLWQLAPPAPVMRFRLRLPAFRRVRPCARSTHTRLHVTGRYGLPFLLARAARRPVLIGLALTTAAALWWLSGYVWVIDVTGAQHVPAWQVIATAERLGLRPGARRADVNRQRLAHELPLLIPGIAWAAVTLHGTRATIEVAERTQPPASMADAAYPADVVAARDGVVTSVLTLTGRPLIEPGDTVRRGQVLISGRVAESEGRTALVHARGAVQARVWYDAYVEVALDRTVLEPTGRVRTRRALRILGRRVDLGRWRAVPFADYRLDRRTWGLSWHGVALPIELVTYRYQEVARLHRRVSVAGAQAVADARARAEVRAQIPEGARILGETSDLVQVTAGRVGVEARVEVEQNIGRPRALVGTAP